MSEDQGKPTNSKASEQEGDEALSALYRQLPEEPVPEQLDQLILGAAKVEAEHMQSSTVLETEGRFSRRNSRLRYMGSLAASFLVGVVAVQLYLQTEELADSVHHMPLPEVARPASVKAPSSTDLASPLVAPAPMEATESMTASDVEMDNSFAVSVYEEEAVELESSVSRSFAVEEAKVVEQVQSMDDSAGVGSSITIQQTGGAARSETSAFSSAPASAPSKPKAPPAKKLKAKAAPKPVAETKSTQTLEPGFDSRSLYKTDGQAERRSKEAVNVEKRSTRQLFEKKQEVHSEDAVGLIAPSSSTISTVPEYRQTKEKWVAYIKELIERGELSEAEDEILAYRKVHGEFPR